MLQMTVMTVCRLLGDVAKASVRVRIPVTPAPTNAVPSKLIIQIYNILQMTVMTVCRLLGDVVKASVRGRIPVTPAPTNAVPSKLIQVRKLKIS